MRYLPQEDEVNSSFQMFNDSEVPRFEQLNENEAQVFIPETNLITFNREITEPKSPNHKETNRDFSSTATQNIPIEVERNSILSHSDREVQVSQFHIQTLNIKNTTTNQTKFCNCKKSKCLKLYCECFIQGRVCGRWCKCEGCKNCESAKDLRQIIVSETIQKNPLAFKSKYKTMKRSNTKLHARGCTCKKTGCQKNYCECYNAKTGCSRLCKCIGCKNTHIEVEDSEVPLYYERVLRKRRKINKLANPLLVAPQSKENNQE